jgi:hypothetical protein
MKLAGFLLVAIGFLAGAYHLTGVGGAVIGPGFLVSFVTATAGVVALRVSTRKRRGAKDKVISDMKSTVESLSSLAGGVEQLLAERDSINVYDLPGEIDARFTDDLERFVEARESIAVAYGLPAYAGVMSHFAAGERYLNRVWSCSVDGYIDEAHAYLGHARDQFAEGLARLNALA